MKSLLLSTKNTRSILQDSLQFLRSDVPLAITDAEKQWLVEQNVRTIIDLREESERRNSPCSLEADGRFSYFCMPVTGGNRISRDPDAVIPSYLNMVDQQMERILERIWNAPSNVLYFCNAGKDRCGFSTASASFGKK